jgi:nitrous oxidase accessory protein NosD
MRQWIVGLSGLLLLAGMLDARAGTLRVPQQYRSIQRAVDAAAPGDTVLVGPGRYSENILIQKSLVLKSSMGARLTTLDGGRIGSPVGILGTGSENVAVSGFTITGGAFLLESSLAYPNSWGAGVFVDTIAKVTVRDSIITGNSGCAGDGIASFNSSVTVSDNVVRNNDPMDWCPGNGATIRLIGTQEYSPAATVERNEVTDNDGVAISADLFDSIVVRENRISGNGVPLENSPTGAGIVVGLVRTEALIADNWIFHNVASTGAGLVATAFSDPASHFVITGNIILDNVTDLGAAAEGDVILFVMAPSQMQFLGNVVIGRSPGTLVYCSFDNVAMEGNLLINRDPAGQTHFCNH